MIPAPTNPDPNTWTREERNAWACQECGGTINPNVSPDRRHDPTCSLYSTLRCDSPVGRRRWQAIVDFVADSADDASELFAAIAAQVYEADGVTDQQCEWIEGDLVEGGEAAYVSLFLLPVLADVSQLIATAFDLTVGRRPSWIEVDERMIHSDCGVMATELFRRHYDHNAELHDYVNNLEAN